jgi:hypothetical protein
MSIVDSNSFGAKLAHVPLPETSTISKESPLQRIGAVRRQQGMSVRSAARRMHVSIEEVLRQEEPATDMLISELLCWKKALDVPVADLAPQLQRRHRLHQRLVQ